MLAGALSFAVGWLLGYPALRVQHHYLAFVTLAFITVVFLVLRNEEWLTGGVYGINGIARPSLWDVSTLRELFGWSTAQARAVDFYVISLAMLALFSAVLWWILRSPWGRAFVALRENPTRALSLGVDTRRYTLMAFAIGSCFGGCAGAIYAPLVQFIEPDSFALGLSLNLLLMVIVGGSGYFLGPFVGGARRHPRAGMAALHRRLLPHHLCAAGDGADGDLPDRPDRARRARGGRAVAAARRPRRA